VGLFEAAAGAAIVLAQVAQPLDVSLGDVYRRTQDELSQRALLPGESTVLGYDRGVTELVRQYSALWLDIVTGQRRLLELAAASRSLAGVEPGELTAEGRVKHAARLQRAADEAEAQTVQLERSCRLAQDTLSELRGRIAGKIDSLAAAQAACAALGHAAPATLCRLNAETRGLYEVLLAATKREEPGLRSACQSHPVSASAASSEAP